MMGSSIAGREMKMVFKRCGHSFMQYVMYKANREITSSPSSKSRVL